MANWLFFLVNIDWLNHLNEIESVLFDRSRRVDTASELLKILGVSGGVHIVLSRFFISYRNSTVPYQYKIDYEVQTGSSRP